MKAFLQSTLGTLSIWAAVFIVTGIAANWWLGAGYFFIVFCALTFLLIIVGTIIGIRNSIKDAQETAEKKAE